MQFRALVLSAAVCVLLAACGQKEEGAKRGPDIPDLDVSTVQSVDYFRAHLDGAKKLAEWCRSNLKSSVATVKEGQGAVLSQNCQNASFAVFSPTKSVKDGKTYKSYN